MPGPKSLPAIGMLVLLTTAAGTAAAQEMIGDRPRILVPSQPPTKKELDRREALYRYTLGLLCEREDRLLEALKAFEDSAQLDPTASEPLRAQVPLLLLLERPRDALKRLDEVLALDPHDHESWFLAARLHKGLGELKDFRVRLEKGLAVPGLVKDDPAVAQQLYLDLAHHLEVSDAPADAVKAYGEAVKILDHPDVLLDHGPFQREAIVAKAAETYEKIGHLERQLKNFDAALKAYRTALERQPANGGRLNLHLARLIHERGNSQEALGYLEAYLRLQPQGTEAYQLKIDLLTKLQRSHEVLGWLEQASRADPLNVNLRLLLAQRYATERQRDQAERVYLALLQESPSEEVYRGYYGLFRDTPLVAGDRILSDLDRVIRLANKKPPEAGSMRAGDQARAMLTVLRSDADLARYLLDAAHRPEKANQDFDYETRYFLAVLADQYAKLDQAEQFFRRALADPRQINEAPLYSGLLRVLWKGHKYSEIVRLCQQGLRNSKFTNHLLFHGDLAKAQARLGKLREAEASADRAMEMAGDRDRLFAAHIKVRILIQAQKYPEAETLGKKLFEEVSAPGDVQEVRYLLSNIYSAWKKMERCEQLLAEILKTDPGNATVNNDLGYIWADQNKNLKQAEEMIRKAIELDRRQRKTGASEDKDNAAYIDSLGWVLFRRGQLDEARRELERAVALPEGDDPVLWDHLGDVYFRMERYVQALSAWEHSIELYEKESGRPRDDRYRDVQRKTKMAKELVRAQ